MTRRRVMIAVVAVAILALGLVVYRVSNPPAQKSDSPFLTAEDFPSGYVVARLSNTAPPGIGGQTVPAACGPVIAQQAGRSLRSSIVGILAEPADATRPTYAQSIVTGGETVTQTTDVVRRCPSYRQRSGDESFESTSSILPAPQGCPSDALVIRSRTRYSGPSSQSDSTALTAYVQGRTAVGELSSALLQPTSPIPDDFCRLTTLVAERLDNS
ncbi:hypothetical protein [Williamsia deligens]|uniref:PknH-like extracellular domain-containing protein n=1 Tax=Williamsia deligens TaxID=321325 RepID=A0ABW3G2K6_9NOCA|nr:hypothetical protein [Williamsia deligens]MCP2194499.1 hypothetical protein [Williamsia deligens]